MRNRIPPQAFAKPHLPPSAPVVPDPDYTVHAKIKPGTINVVQIGYFQRGQPRARVISSQPFMGQMPPQMFLGLLHHTANVVAHTIGNVVGLNVGIDGRSLEDACKSACSAFEKHAEGCLIDPRTKQKIVNTEADGSILDKSNGADQKPSEDEKPYSGPLILPN